MESELPATIYLTWLLILVYWDGDTGWEDDDVTAREYRLCSVRRPAASSSYDDLLSPIQPASPTASVSGYLTAVRGPDPVGAVGSTGTL